MMTPGMSADAQRVREQISTEWGYPYDPLDDFALPGVGSAIAGGSLAAATQRVARAFVHAITSRQRETRHMVRTECEAESVTSGSLAPIHRLSMTQKPGNSRAAMSRRYVTPSK